MKQKSRFVLVILGLLTLVSAGLLLGFLGGTTYATRKSADQLVAMQWGGFAGEAGEAVYGAHIFLRKDVGGYDVEARVLIGPEQDGSFHDCGTLGKVKSQEEAIRRYGQIEWREDGLAIGNYFLPRETLEASR